MKFGNISNAELVSQLKNLIQVETRTTSEIVEYVAEVDRRKLYLDLGYTSLFSFLVEELRYSAGSAQRRIDAARLLHSVPEVKSDLESGALNLMQVSVVAQAVRQKSKECPSTPITVDQKKDLLESVKGLDLDEARKVAATTLDLELKTIERKIPQKDGSVRMELVFTADQMAVFQRVKELISHTHPNPSWAEVMAQCGTEYLKRKDPLAKNARPSRGVDSRKIKYAQESNGTEKTGSDERIKNASAEAPKKHPTTSTVEVNSSPKRQPIPAHIRRAVFQRDRDCRWRDPRTGRVCRGKHQLQVDHIVGVCDGGSNNIENLQLLCAVHNRLKYERGDVFRARTA